MCYLEANLSTVLIEVLFGPHQCFTLRYVRLRYVVLVDAQLSRYVRVSKLFLQHGKRNASFNQLSRKAMAESV